MGLTVVRSTGTLFSREAAMGRSVAYLQDGSCVVGYLDNNQTDVSGDGGDSTGYTKLYLYHSVDRVTWTLKNTISISTSSYNGLVEYWSMCIDANQNLHVAWASRNDGHIKYIKGTYSIGPSWAFSAPVNAYTNPGAGYQFTRIDIDAIGTGSDNPVIMSFLNYTAGGGAIYGAIAVKNNSGTWVTNSSWNPLSNSGGTIPLKDDVSVSATQEASPDGTGAHYFAASMAARTYGLDLGMQIRIYSVNLTTGVITLAKQWYGLTTPLRARVFYEGSVAGVKTWVVGGYYWDVGTSGNNALGSWCWRFSLANDGVTVSAPSGAQTSYAYSQSTGTDSTGYIPCAMTYNPVDKKLIWHWSYGTQIRSRIASMNVNSIAIRAGHLTDSDGTNSASTVGDTHGNPQTRNVTSTSLDTFHMTDLFNFFHSRTLIAPQGKCVISSPGSGSTIQAARPTLYPVFNIGLTYAPRGYKAQFQLASDIGFTTNLYSWVEDDAYLSTAGGTAAPTSWSSGSPWTVLASIPQGTWYVRSRLIDDFGGVGSWNTLLSPYTISHPPAASNLQPGSGSFFLLYGQPTTFSWTFSDPSGGYDSQSAYQIIVERASDSLQVWDSGKITSSATSATLTVSSSYKDTDLRWKIRLWDSENVAGAYVQAGGVFQLTDPPSVTISSPTGTITTGIPTVNWTNGISSPKVQSYYRVQISQGGVTILDTDWVSGSVTSYATPAGLLVNNSSYTFTVSVKDNLGLQATRTSTVTTSYTPPAAPSGAATSSIYLFEYSTRGYVYFSMSGTGQDADFQSYNLYRRKIGASTWDLVKQWTVPSTRITALDYIPVSGQTYDYAVTQIVNRYGDILESAKATLRRVTPSDDKYWLFSKSDTEKSMPLYSVTSDGYTEEYEQETYNIIGRGRHTDYGDRLGLSGSLTIKLRDRMTTGIAKVNYIKNPKLTTRDTPNSDPTGWVTNSNGTVGTKTVSYNGALEPPPCGGGECLTVQASAMGTAATDYLEVYQDISQLDMPMGAAQDFNISFYAGGLPVAVNLVVVFIYYNSSNSVISTTTAVNLSPSEYYFPTPGVGSVDYGLTGQYWGRYVQTGTTPTNYDHMRVHVRMRGTGSGTTGLTKALNITSAQLALTTTPGQYVDGDQIGGQWRGDPDISASETTGYYTARQMKQKLEAYKLLREFGYLRTPFGDIYTVSLGNMNLSRIAGVSVNEFSDVELPYAEVAF